MFLKIQMAQVTELVEGNSCNWNEYVDRIRLNRVLKENLKILVKRERGLGGRLKMIEGFCFLNVYSRSWYA